MAPTHSGPTQQDEAVSLLDVLYADRAMSALFSETATIEGWLATETALARAQATVGVIAEAEAEAIATTCTAESIDRHRLWHESRNVGYPILPLVRMLTEQLPEAAVGKLHLGATTQDIMDTGLALQLSAALDRLAVLVDSAGNALSRRITQHRRTIMAGRTHGQQAVPTTLGAKLAVFLGEFTRHRTRIRQLRPRLCVVSLYGAAGTSAAYGEQAAALRREVARLLALHVDDVPWHGARDAIAEFGFVCAALAETCARFAREIIDLSRTEIGELSEGAGRDRGASSTMPQKANPVLAEATIGFAVTASTSVQGLLRAMEAGHERAAGEWHVEWDAIPRVSIAAASAVALTCSLVAEFTVDEAAMQRNMRADGGLLMAEAFMMQLAPSLGRERAHDLVHAAAESLRASDKRTNLLAEIARSDPTAANVLSGVIRPEDYLGDVAVTCASAIAAWSRP